MACEVTGLKAQWAVTDSDGICHYYNSVRTLIKALQQRGVEISSPNFFEMVFRRQHGKELSEARLSRFKDNKIKSITQIKNSLKLF